VSGVLPGFLFNLRCGVLTALSFDQAVCFPASNITTFIFQSFSGLILAFLDLGQVAFFAEFVV